MLQDLSLCVLLPTRLPVCILYVNKKLFLERKKQKLSVFASDDDIENPEKFINYYK